MPFFRLVLCCILTITASSAVHSPHLNTDYKMQCLYLYKFSQYVSWPSAKPTEEFTIGVVGISSIIPVLEKYIATKNASSAVKYRLLKFSNVQSITNCNIVYVTKEQVNNFEMIVKFFAKKQTLVVSEVAGLIKRGSCVNFIGEEGASTKIQVNRTAIAAHDLKAGPEFYKIATEIF